MRLISVAVPVPFLDLLTYNVPPSIELPPVGARVRVWPAHVDPTVAYHEHLHVASGAEILDTWAVDLRGW